LGIGTLPLLGPSPLVLRHVPVVRGHDLPPVLVHAVVLLTANISHL
jgi:hypothetical protein